MANPPTSVMMYNPAATLMPVIGSKLNPCVLSHPATRALTPIGCAPRRGFTYRSMAMPVIAGPAITGIAIDLYVKPLRGAHPMGVSARVAGWLSTHGFNFDPITGINVAAGLYIITLVGGFAILYTQMVLM